MTTFNQDGDKKCAEWRSDFEIKRELDDMGVDVFEPETSFENDIAQRLADFSSYVLYEGKERCLEILENCNNDDSVGELQGGNENFKIYRVSFPDDELFDGEENVDEEDTAKSSSTKNKKISKANTNKKVKKIKKDFHSNQNNNGAICLLDEFNNNQERRNYKNTEALTVDTFKEYMLGMCQRRSQNRSNDIQQNYSRLGNLMLILQFGGPTRGQVRHIDNMVPNLQICLYMSAFCPTTIVYGMEEDEDDSITPITDAKRLFKYWQKQHNHQIPKLIENILQIKGNQKLKTKWYTKFFSFWDTIDSHLKCFGKLYQPVSHELGLKNVEPGTTLIAGGNEVHAGPPTNGPRMFAFAIGIPQIKNNILLDYDDVHIDEESDLEENMENDVRDGTNDGEVQYSPVLLHIDFCCLLFTILDYEYSSTAGVDESDIEESKFFLLHILLDLIRDYPMMTYIYQIITSDEDNRERDYLKNWLEKVLRIITLQSKSNNNENDQNLVSYIHEAIDDDLIFYTPEVIQRRLRKKRKKKKRVLSKN